LNWQGSPDGGHWFRGAGQQLNGRNEQIYETMLCDMMKTTSSPDQPGKGAAGNRFARHPVATISALLLSFLLIGLVALELFLRNFSGLGNPVLYELSPLYGYRPKSDQVIEPRGGMGFLYGARVTNNNLGLRAAGEWDDNPAGKVLFLGDSVTYGGQYVADDQLFSSVAGNSLPGWQVGNGGVNAWGVENIAGLVLDYGFSPAEVVVTCLIEGDFYRGTTRASSVPFWTERPRFGLQDLLMHVIWRINESRYGSSVDAAVQDQAHLDRIVDRAVKRLVELDHYYQQQRVRHFVFILPSRSQVVGEEPPDDRVRLALGRYGIDASYLLPGLRAMEPDARNRRGWYHDEVHLEPSGHTAYGILIGGALAGAVSIDPEP
jgi:hypothetical protein